MYVLGSACHQSLRTTQWSRASARVDRHGLHTTNWSPLRPITTHGEPEFDPVIDEGLWMAHDEFVVAGRRADAPVLGLLRVARVAEQASEAGCVLGVVAGRRERAQTGD
jgi:hypothetical protein